MTERERQRLTDRQTDRDTESERERERQRELIDLLKAQVTERERDRD